MRELDNSELKRWGDIRKKGFVVYAIRWLIYSVIFMLITQGAVLLFDKRNIGVSDIFAALLVHVPIGIVISILRWRILDKRYKNLM